MRIVRPPPSLCLQDNPAGQAPNVVVQPKAAFGWGDHDIKVENRCRYSIMVAVEAQSDTGEPSGDCTNGVTAAGSWCIRGFFSVAPGEVTSNLLGTDNGYVNYYAYIDDPSLNYYTWSGSRCMRMDGAFCNDGYDCYCFVEVRMGIHLAELVCVEMHESPQTAT